MIINSLQPVQFPQFGVNRNRMTISRSKLQGEICKKVENVSNIVQNVWHSRILTLHLPDRSQVLEGINRTSGENIVRLTTQSVKGNASQTSTPKEIPISMITKIKKNHYDKVKQNQVKQEEKSRSSSIVQRALLKIQNHQEKRPYEFGFEIHLATRNYLFLTQSEAESNQWIRVLKLVV